MLIHEHLPQSAGYPDRLRRLDKPPACLYTLGDLPNDAPAVAIVGARKCTPYGEEVARQFAGELARAGVVIVSGLAYGIDSIAQQAAIDAGGKTVAVLAHGLDRIYPHANRNLAKRILETGGALVSTYPKGTEPLPYRFIERNWLIAALCGGTVIIESRAKGGSLHTAKFTNEVGGTVMAVPGGIFDENSAGPNNLIRNGAIPVTSSSDVLQGLGLPTGLIPASVIRAQNPHEEHILKYIEKHKARGGATEALIETTALTAPQFASVISLMEITGKVRNLGGGRWAHR